MPSRAVTAGQIDDFEGGTVMGWSEGGSPNPPVNQTSGGPAGAGDNYLLNVSSGGAGPGSKLVQFNEAQWAGDYLAAGVSRIHVWMANFGSTTLHMRIAIRGFGGLTYYGSTSAFVLPADGVWRATSFGLSESELSLIAGASSLAEALASVDTLRILSSSAGPAWAGEGIAATLGVDSITAAAGADVPPVPDGTLGTPMLASRASQDGSVIELSWDVSTCPAPQYHILFGALANVSSLALDGAMCAIGTSGSFSWSSAPSGDAWFLLVSDDGAGAEGSWGTDSNGAQLGGSTVSGRCGTFYRDNTPTCP